MASMAQEIKGKAAEGNAQNVANMVWAFATLGGSARGSRGQREQALGLSGGGSCLLCGAAGGSCVEGGVVWRELETTESPVGGTPANSHTC